jgi:hypothetical protein
MQLLERVFSFLPGHWLFLGGVCRAWMQSYKHLPACEILKLSLDFHEASEKVACDWSPTLVTAVFESPSRLRLAVACGLQLNPPDEHDEDDEEDWRPSSSSELQYIAGLHADEAVLSLAEELGMPLSSEVVKGVAASGRVKLLKHLIEERQCAMPRNTVCSAAYSDSIDVLKYVAERGCMFTAYSCSDAARFGRLHALQHILSTLQCTCDQQPHGLDERCDSCEWIAESSVHDAAMSGNIEVLQWLQQQYPHATTDNAMDGAASAGQTAMCAYLHSQQPTESPLCRAACISAAFRGRVETLNWLFQHGYPWNAKQLRRCAARGGSIPMMQLLQQQGVVSTVAQLTDMLRCAGAHHNLQAAKWLRQ